MDVVEYDDDFDLATDAAAMIPINSSKVKVVELCAAESTNSECNVQHSAPIIAALS